MSASDLNNHSNIISSTKNVKDSLSDTGQSCEVDNTKVMWDTPEKKPASTTLEDQLAGAATTIDSSIESFQSPSICSTRSILQIQKNGSASESIIVGNKQCSSVFKGLKEDKIDTKNVIDRDSLLGSCRDNIPLEIALESSVSVGVSNDLAYTIILTVAITMAAIGIVSGQDWLSFFTNSARLGAIVLLTLAYIYRKWLAVAIKTIPRDIKGGYRYAKVLYHVGRAQRNNWTVNELFYQNVRKHPNKVCFYFEDDAWTFKQVDEASNRVGNYFASIQLQKGDTVSLFMENRPEYVCIWLGLCKIGVVPALINFNLRLGPLKHSITISKSKLVIYGQELSSAIEDILNTVGLEKVPLYCYGASGKEILAGVTVLDAVLLSSSADVPVPSEPINFTDKLLYIYTSGTTGLPKAAVIKHSRFIFFTMGIHYFIGVSKEEIIYDPLPMYHTAGGMLGVGQAVLFGSTAVLRKKFSATAYWQDCAKYGCTAAQYIGEICRYLLIQPPSPEDRHHKVKLMFGNGLRPQIWAEFATRFGITTISEFYGATEGNCNIINIDNRIGAVGFISRIMPFIYPVTLIKVNEETGEPVRDPRTGLCIRCKPNEDGELVGKIVANHPVREFQGYADATATNKKIVSDVFRKGDAAFRTGDVLMMDDYGYFFFKDRTGDTFRWKGENCSTSEVEAVVSNVCGLKDAVVYGVEIPGSEGRAGMVAVLDPDESIDLNVFGAGVTKALPAYSRPVFVRIIKQMDMTGTYKMKKLDLQKEGYNITVVSDKIFCLCGGRYSLVDKELYSKIMSGQMRL